MESGRQWLAWNCMFRSSCFAEEEKRSAKRRTADADSARVRIRSRSLSALPSTRVTCRIAKSTYNLICCAANLSHNVADGSSRCRAGKRCLHKHVQRVREVLKSQTKYFCMSIRTSQVPVVFHSLSRHISAIRGLSALWVTCKQLPLPYVSTNFEQLGIHRH